MAPLIVAHRGASHDAPENTLAAFSLAWLHGADAVETDVHLSRDGKLVCIHDADLKRTAGADVRVAMATATELARFDVPTFDQLLATVPGGKRVFVEIKDGPMSVLALERTLARGRVTADQVVVIAFDNEILTTARRVLPDCKTYWLTSFKRRTPADRWVPTIDQVLHTVESCGAAGVGVAAHEAVDRAFVEPLHAAGRSINVWTVNDEATAARFTALGVDSITTDQPAWLRTTLAGRP